MIGQLTGEGDADADEVKKNPTIATQEDSALNFQKIEPNLKSACPHLKIKTDIKNNHVFHWEQSKGRSSAYR